MLIKDLSSIIDKRRELPSHTEAEVYEHLSKKYPLISYHGRDVFLFSSERKFGDRRHIVSFHDANTPFTPEHIYQYVIIKYCYRDVWRLHVDGEPVTLHEGDMLITDRLVPQSIEATTPLMQGVSLILDQSFFRDMFPRAEHLDLPEFGLSLLTPGAIHTSYRVYQSHDDELVGSLIDQILCEHLDPRPASDELIDHAIASLLLNVLDRYEQDGRNGMANTNGSALMGKIREYIANHFQVGSLQEMAEDLGYERTYLSKFIKKTTGSTFKELVNEERMRAASLLLLSCPDPVYEIAAAVGISGLSAFYQRFRAYTGLTPQEFRDQSKS